MKFTVEINSDQNFTSEELKKDFLKIHFSEIKKLFQKKFLIKEIIEKEETQIVSELYIVQVPRVGEFFSVEKQLFQVIAVEHNFQDQENGILFVKKTNKILQTIEVKNFI